MVAGISQGCGSEEPCRHSLRALVLYVPNSRSGLGKIDHAMPIGFQEP